MAAGPEISSSGGTGGRRENESRGRGGVPPQDSAGIQRTRTRLWSSGGDATHPAEEAPHRGPAPPTGRRPVQGPRPARAATESTRPPDDRTAEGRATAPRKRESGHVTHLVLPLTGGCSVHLPGRIIELRGRASVFSDASDLARVPRDTRAEIASGAGGRFALAGARCGRRLPVRYGPAPEVPAEGDGAGVSGTAGHATYDLNVTAGPGKEREWKICFHPDDVTEGHR
ncbi:5-deoxy-glucuronate isomerase [Streptomyces citrinus]|uniref:5-deoxy-glucuronate isomerase n=1 Tax=Streptomyces citrinus TaxID=3118173 RepID=UPI003CC63F69